MIAQFENEGETSILIHWPEENRCLGGVKADHALWDEAVKIATPYVAPVIDPKVARANALALLDPLVAQITRYEILGLSSDIAKAKLAAKVAEIDQKYPA